MFNIQRDKSRILGGGRQCGTDEAVSSANRYDASLRVAEVDVASKPVHGYVSWVFQAETHKHLWVFGLVLWLADKTFVSLCVLNISNRLR